MDTKQLIFRLKTRVADLLQNGYLPAGAEEPSELSPKELTEVGRLLLSIAKHEREEEITKPNESKITPFPALPFSMGANDQAS
jgi:hypothetical protein